MNFSVSSPNADAIPPRSALVGALVAAIASISFAAIFFKLSFPTHPLVAAGWRLVIAAILLSPFVVKGIRLGSFTPGMRKAAVLGGFLYGLHFGSWVSSLALTSVAASVTLVTINPIFLGLLSLMTKKDKPDSRFWWGALLAIVGLAILGGSGFSLGEDALLGNALAVFGALAMSFYLFNARRQGPALDWLAFSGVATAVGGVSLIACAFIFGISLMPSSTEAFGFIALAAIFPQMVGHNLLTFAVRHIKPTSVAMAIVAEPVGATVLAWLWLAESLEALTALGCAVTLSAVLLVIWGGRRADIDKLA
jgi:drug/metabolite transporter (DMT)-like permease